MIVAWTTVLATEKVRSSQILKIFSRSLKNLLSNWMQGYEKDGFKILGWQTWKNTTAIYRDWGDFQRSKFVGMEVAGVKAW